MTTRAAMVVFMFLFASGMSLAQDPGSVGISFEAGDQSGIGITWHVSKSFMLRPLLTFESTEALSYWSYYGARYERVNYYGLDLGFLFPVYSHENLHLYTGAVLQYGRAVWERGSDTDWWGGDVVFGIRYMVAKRLGLFGEVGATYRVNGGWDGVRDYGLYTGALGATFYLN